MSSSHLRSHMAFAMRDSSGGSRSTFSFVPTHAE